MNKKPFSCMSGLMGGAALVLTAVMSPAALAQDDAAAIERGKNAAMVCIACHQANGGGMSIPGGESWPRLAGQDRDYLVAQLKAFKDGTRDNISMKPFSMMLNDDQMMDVAIYFESLPFPDTINVTVNADEALLEHGQKLVEHGDWDRYIVSCQSCHGPGSQGVGHFFPNIAGQHEGYIAAQLKHWQDGSRKNDPQDLMGSIARRMNDRDIQAVSAWLAKQEATSKE